MTSLVAFDLETTGLDPQRDKIIEIGAVKFDGTRILDTYQTLVNPQRAISPEITQLTSITNEMVRSAPLIEETRDEFAAFLGNDPLLGHNISFDLSFLRSNRFVLVNEEVDTYDLASVLMPTASRYNLGSLVEILKIKTQGLQSHRALDDARMTVEVFLRFVQMGDELPLELVREIVDQGKGLSWGGKWFFNQLLRQRIHEPVQAKKVRQEDYGVLFGSLEELALPPLKPKAVLESLNEDEVAAHLEPGGTFSRFMNQFESRSQQIEMARMVANAFNNSQHFMVEAGTGTGKSFAYLVPAALWAIHNQTRVLISTNTINLQDQLIKKDIPDTQQALGLDLRATVLKGRSNYLCPRRLEGLRFRGPRSREEMRMLAKVLVWLHQGGSGDRGELNLNGGLEWETWSKLSAEDETCGAEACMNRLGGVCPYFRARQSALRAHIIVVNHALLLADVVTENRVLPDYDYLIIDEAHHLEDASTSALSYKVSNKDVKRSFEELGSPKTGALGNVTAGLQGRVSEEQFSAYHEVLEEITDLAFRADHEFDRVFDSMQTFMEDMREGKEVSEYGQRVRVELSTTRQPIWSQIEMCWQNASTTLESMLNDLSRLIREISDLDFAQELEVNEDLTELARLTRRFQETLTNFSSLIYEPEPSNVYWLEIEPRSERFSVNMAPLHIGPLMEKYLWNEKQSVILTSATLTTSGDFDYLRNRLNAETADELLLGSPFDFETSTLLYLPIDMPEPIDRSQYQLWVERTLLRLAKATGGRMLVLFTSYKQLRLTSRSITPLLNKDHIQVFEQGEGPSSNALLETFRAAERAVLLGTRSFWEGVDVPGQALSVLVIVRLPFDVPSDPIITARSETFENPFQEYQLPEAILRFRQGFGRLIRTKSDRGVVTVLDSRILNKQYGQLFLNSLPPCTQKRGPVEELPAVAARWLDL
ncbi:MAG TPA: helicase C-terminal domain-containing protein [Anaerolineaceae bacterium]|jgi:ATP-dependent DNA helicase DinG|nr:helicase C-terminal domain-containing protein [Anaerolineaceae bacterium]